ncbi:hypothetical protein [Streptomyces sp. NPDC051310]|uniref:hypothetical protein n=1 Tax=Streptomyces sp. NPDC051310 TaxID=3365649 RepID=UPI0037B06581
MSEQPLHLRAPLAVRDVQELLALALEDVEGDEMRGPAVGSDGRTPRERAAVRAVGTKTPARDDGAAARHGAAKGRTAAGLAGPRARGQCLADLIGGGRQVRRPRR